LHSFSSPPPVNTGEKQAKVDNIMDITVSTTLFQFDILVKGFFPFQHGRVENKGNKVRFIYLTNPKERGMLGVYGR
jgi:hypothetical protein